MSPVKGEGAASACPIPQDKTVNRKKQRRTIDAAFFTYAPLTVDFLMSASP